MTHIGRRDTLHAISGWLYELANLTAGSAPLADAKAKVASIATALADDFPSEAFSRQSLLAVARQCKFFPTYGEVCTHLSAWWTDHRPQPIALPAPRMPWQHDHTPTPERRAPTTRALESIRDIIARGVATMNADEADRELKHAERVAKAPTRPMARLSPTQLVEAYKQAGISHPRVQP